MESTQFAHEEAPVFHFVWSDVELDLYFTLRQRHAGNVEDFAAGSGHGAPGVVLAPGEAFPALALPELHPRGAADEGDRKGHQDRLDNPKTSRLQHCLTPHGTLE